MSEDHSLIAGLLSGDDIDELKFSDSQLEYVTDTNNGSYSSQISWDLLQITSKWTQMREAFITIPIALSAAAFSATPVVAFKNSVLSIIRGLTVTFGTRTILNEIDTQFITNLRLLLEQNIDWATSNREHLMFSKDYVNPAVLSTLTTSANISNPKTALYTAAVSGTVNSLNPVANLGFMERNNALINSTNVSGAFSTTSVTTTLYIPVIYLSPLFQKLGPIINTRIFLNVLLNTNASGSSYSPVCLGTVQAGTVENSGTACTVAVVGPCRWYYRNVKFAPEQAHAIAKKLESGGFTRRLEYTETDTVLSFTNVASTSSFQHQIAMSSTHPQRVWIGMFPTGTVNSQNWPSPCVTGKFGLSNLNVNVNGSPYYNVMRTSLYELYDDLRDQMTPSTSGDDNSSLINFSDFVNTYRWHVIDLTRSKDAMADPNMAVSIAVTGNPIAATAVDFIYILERKKVCILHFGSGEVTVELGANL
jgi:hypothetical protein